jgi:hypothetical protein
MKRRKEKGKEERNDEIERKMNESRDEGTKQIRNKLLL